MGFIVTNLTWRSKRFVRFYNGRGTAEQWIKEGKNAVKWTKLSRRTFKDNQARLQLSLRKRLSGRLQSGLMSITNSRTITVSGKAA